MKRISLLVAGLFTISLGFGQIERNNAKTDNHTQIAGTKFFIVPPAGFIAATNFQGFQQVSTGASILVIEIPGPYSESAKGLNEEGLKSKGVILHNSEEIRINGKEAMFLTAEQSAYGKSFSKYILVFGDSTATFMVNGTFPNELAELGEDIRESMLSVIYQPDLVVDPLSSVPFTIDTENTKLKFAKNITGTLLYTVDGKVPTESEDKSSFIVGLSLANVQSNDKKLAAINRIKRIPSQDLKLDENRINEIEINGISGYEIVGEGVDKNTGTRELIYQVMLFADNGYYIIIGTTRRDFEQDLEMFKRVARTLRRK